MLSIIGYLLGVSIDAQAYSLFSLNARSSKTPERCSVGKIDKLVDHRQRTSYLLCIGQEALLIIKLSS